MSLPPPNFVRQCHKEMRDSGGMFDAEIGVQEVTTTKNNRFRAYVAGSFGGGVQCFRDTEEEAMKELGRLWRQMFG